MEKDRYINDLKDIKNLMNRSSKFISLSGWSGIVIGSIALIAAFFGSRVIAENGTLLKNNRYDPQLIFDLRVELFSIAAVTLIVSLIVGIIFTVNKSKRLGEKIWTKQSQILLTNLAIPLVVGGIVCILFYLKSEYGVIAPLTLIFYGLALINASKYTLGEIRSLGILNCILGIIGLYFIGYGILLWAIGFGVLHIIYGVMMKIKHN